MIKKFNVNIARRIDELEAVSRKLQIKNIIWRLIFRGKGLEFEGYRKMMPDDDASFIDWKASVRTDELLVKIFKEERDLKIYFLIDVSDNMLFGSADKLKCEYAAELVASLAHLIITNGDNVGLVLYSDKIIKVIKPGKGMKQFFSLQRELLDIKNYGGKSDLGKTLNEVMAILDDSINSIFIVSDFLKIKQEDETIVKVLGRRFETISLMVKDIRDIILPDDVREVIVSDPETGKQILIDPGLIRERYEEYSRRQEMAVKHMFLRSRIDCLKMITEKPFILPLVIFLKTRVKFGKAEIPT